MKKFTDEFKEQVKDLDIEHIKTLEEMLDSIVLKGIEENPQSLNPEKKGKRGKNPKTKAKNLLDRFVEHKEKIMRFLTDLKVPFENNQAERDIRMMNYRKKYLELLEPHKERKLSAELERTFLQSERIIYRLSTVFYRHSKESR